MRVINVTTGQRMYFPDYAFLMSLYYDCGKSWRKVRNALAAMD